MSSSSWPCLAVAATFVSVTLRREIEFSFGVCCPPDGAPVGLGGLGWHTAAPASLSHHNGEEMIPESSSCPGGRWCRVWECREGGNKVNIEHRPRCAGEAELGEVWEWFLPSSLPSRLWFSPRCGLRSFLCPQQRRGRNSWPLSSSWPVPAAQGLCSAAPSQAGIHSLLCAQIGQSCRGRIHSQGSALPGVVWNPKAWSRPWGRQAAGSVWSSESLGFGSCFYWGNHSQPLLFILSRWKNSAIKLM